MLPMPVITGDAREWRRKVAVARKHMGSELDNVLAGWCDLVIGDMVIHAKRDTNRFIVGWIKAGWGVGVTGYALPALGPSEYRPLYRAQLVRQIEIAGAKALSLEKRIAQWFTAKSRPIMGWSAEARAAAMQYRHLEMRGREELAKFDADPFAIVIGVGAGAVFRFGRGKTDAEEAIYASNISPVVRVRTLKARNFVEATRYKASGTVKVTVRSNKDHGGTGTLRTVGGVRIAELHNREAHASLVERRTRVFAKAVGKLKRYGAVRVASSAVQRVARAADIQPGRAS